MGKLLIILFATRRAAPQGKVVIDAFRLINPATAMQGQEPRQTTSNIGHLNKPTIHSLIHGLNRHYYSCVGATNATPRLADADVFYLLSPRQTCHQLPQDRTRAEHVGQPAQAQLDRGAQVEGLGSASR